MSSAILLASPPVASTECDPESETFLFSSNSLSVVTCMSFASLFLWGSLLKMPSMSDANKTRSA